MIDPFVMRLALAGFAPVAVGYVWYHPRVFGVAWMRHIKLSPLMREMHHRFLPHTLLLTWFLGAVSAYACSSLVEQPITLEKGIPFIMLAWAGFILPPLAAKVFWTHESSMLFLIDAAYALASLIGIVALLAL